MYQLDTSDAFLPASNQKETGAYSDKRRLVRPFGQINVIEKDADLLAKVNHDARFQCPLNSMSITAPIGRRRNGKPR